MNPIENFFSKYSDEKNISNFKAVAIAEGISCFFLYFVGMPLNYTYHQTWTLVLMIIIGNIHGLFFTLYLILTLPAKKIYNWDDEDFVFALIAAFFPFATVWVEKKLARFDRE